MRNQIPLKLWHPLIRVHQALVSKGWHDPLSPDEKELLEALEKFLDASEQEEAKEDVDQAG